MRALQVISKVVPEPENREKVLKKYQGTSDIISDLLFCFKTFNHQAEPTAQYFIGDSSKEEARRLYDFIKHNFKYSAEPEAVQTTRSFSRIIHDNETVDCKHNALLASSIAYQMGYNVVFRFVSYNPGTNYGHVYVLINKPGESKWYVIDPLQDFDYEKFFYSKKDYSVNNKKKNKMLSRLTGTGEHLGRNGLDVYVSGVGAIKLFKDDGVVKKALKKAGKVVKTVSLAPVRGAGLALIDLNFRNFAGRLKTIAAKNPAAIDSLVKTFGFDKSTLLSNINKGAAKKPLFGEGKTNGVGSAAATAALITAAAPIIIVLVKMFKDNGLPDPTDSSTEKTASKDLETLPDSDSQSEKNKKALKNTGLVAAGLVAAKLLAAKFF